MLYRLHILEQISAAIVVLGMARKISQFQIRFFWSSLVTFPDQVFLNVTNSGQELNGVSVLRDGTMIRML